MSDGTAVISTGVIPVVIPVPVVSALIHVPSCDTYTGCDIGNESTSKAAGDTPPRPVRLAPRGPVVAISRGRGTALWRVGW